MILVDMALPGDLAPEDVAVLVERWTQTIRHVLVSEGVHVGAARGVVLPLTSDQLLAGLQLASQVLS